MGSTGYARRCQNCETMSCVALSSGRGPFCRHFLLGEGGKKREARLDNAFIICPWFGQFRTSLDNVILTLDNVMTFLFSSPVLDNVDSNYWMDNSVPIDKVEVGPIWILAFCPRIMSAGANVWNNMWKLPCTKSGLYDFKQVLKLPVREKVYWHWLHLLYSYLLCDLRCALKWPVREDEF